MAKNKDVKRYKCMNFGGCAKADANEIIEIPTIDTMDGTPPCPHCHQNTLVEVPPETPWWKYIAIAAGAAVVLGGGGYALYSASSKPSPEGIMLNHTQKTLFVGEKDTLTATITPEGCDGKLTWKTSMDGKLSVEDGIVTANKEGKGNVRVVLEGEDGIKAVCEYTIKAKDGGIDEPGGVDDAQVKSLTAETAKVELKAGDTKQLKVNVEPSAATVAWQSSDASVATVSSTGLLTAVKAGTATVTATAGDKSCTMSVTVAEKKNGGDGGSNGVKNGVGRANLGYGTYYGELKNGVPHGHGTITYTRSTRIVNSKDFQAQRGDKFEGEFRNGKISGGMGYWYHNGDITAVRP